MYSTPRDIDNTQTSQYVVYTIINLKASVERLKIQRSQVEKLKFESDQKDAIISDLQSNVARLNVLLDNYSSSARTMADTQREVHYFAY